MKNAIKKILWAAIMTGPFICMLFGLFFFYAKDFPQANFWLNLAMIILLYDLMYNKRRGDRNYV